MRRLRQAASRVKQFAPCVLERHGTGQLTDCAAKSHARCEPHDSPPVTAFALAFALAGTFLTFATAVIPTVPILAFAFAFAFAFWWLFVLALTFPFALAL